MIQKILYQEVLWGEKFSEKVTESEISKQNECDHIMKKDGSLNVNIIAFDILYKRLEFSFWGQMKNKVNLI